MSSDRVEQLAKIELFSGLKPAALDLIAKVAIGWHVTYHWPTFNVADISICVGVGLMAVDMLTSGRRNAERAHREATPGPRASHPAG